MHPTPLLLGANLEGADLRVAHLEGAKANEGTRWPDGFDWQASDVERVDDGEGQG